MIRDMLLPGGVWNAQYKQALVNELAQSSQSSFQGASPPYTRAGDARQSLTTHASGSPVRAGAANGTRGACKQAATTSGASDADDATPQEGAEAAAEEAAAEEGGEAGEEAAA